MPLDWEEPKGNPRGRRITVNSMVQVGIYLHILLANKAFSEKKKNENNNIQKKWWWWIYEGTNQGNPVSLPLSLSLSSYPIYTEMLFLWFYVWLFSPTAAGIECLQQLLGCVDEEPHCGLITHPGRGLSEDKNLTRYYEAHTLSHPHPLAAAVNVTTIVQSHLGFAVACFCFHVIFSYPLHTSFSYPRDNERESRLNIGIIFAIGNQMESICYRNVTQHPFC